jgi:putative nucleotidyltransferase with HDIG domain/PAS domain S-box-containing protein
MDGSYRVLSWNAFTAEGGAIYAAARDVTEHKKAEEAIKRSEEQYREVLENVDEIIFSVSFDGGDPMNAKTGFVSPPVKSIFGCEPKEFMNDPSLWFSSIHPDDLPSVAEATDRAIMTGNAATRRYRIRNKETREIRWLEEKIVPQKGPGGVVAGLKGVARDVTERITAEGKIRQEADTTASLLKISEAVAATTNMDKLIANIVENVRAILGPDQVMSYIWDAETNLFRPADAEGVSHETLPFFRTEKIEKETPFINEAFWTGSPVMIDLSEEPARRALKKSGLYAWVKDPHTLAFIPLRGRRVYLGLLVCVYLKDNPRSAAGLSERERGLMKGIGHQVSSALEEARLYKDSIDRAMELSHKIETIKTMNEIDRSILSTVDTEEILGTAVSMTGRLVACDAATVLLLDKEAGGFRYAAGYGLNAGEKSKSEPLEDASASEAVRTLRPLYIPDMRSADRRTPSMFCVVDAGCLSRLVVPLIVKGEGIGVLSICAKRSSAFTPDDLSTLENLSAQIGVALENSRLIKDLEELLIGTIRALSETIDAKSPWTRGHSDRVTSIALEIGGEMDLSEAGMKDLKIAGLLHDIGKIGTYEGILDKPGKLTEEEIREMRKHPGRGADMLSPIKQLQKIIPAIRHHHEFYDGGGYPDGIEGE